VTPAIDWLVGLEPSAGLSAVVVRLLHIIRTKNEVISVALDRLHQNERELQAARHQNKTLREELRRYTGMAVSGRQAA
jgi:hypothetical protein